MESLFSKGQSHRLLLFCTRIAKHRLDTCVAKEASLLKHSQLTVIGIHPNRPMPAFSPQQILSVSHFIPGKGKYDSWATSGPLSIFHKVLLEISHAQSYTYGLWLHLHCRSKDQWLWQTQNSLQDLKYSLSGHLSERFANPSGLEHVSMYVPTEHSKYAFYQLILSMVIILKEDGKIA